ncbi:hypothetical protein MD484_g6689, partial [Candolleomyces efflorescens]
MVSLWLVPGPEDSEALKTIMSPQHETRHSVSKSSYPKFLPHVTLATIPSPDLSEIRNAIPQSQRTFPIKFSSVKVGNHYFRSVYISVEPTEELVTLHKEFHENIKLPPKTPSFPHCSLCYIADEDADRGEREKFAEELRVAGKLREDEEGKPKLLPTLNFPSEIFVFSAGSVLFRTHPDTGVLQVCVIHNTKRNAWILPKGRKDQNESMEVTAVRETFEETGYPCVNANWKEILEAKESVEPFYVTVRQLSDKTLKMIWWYLTWLKGNDAEKVPGVHMPSEAGYVSQFVDAGKAISLLAGTKFEEIVERGVDLVNSSFEDTPSSSASDTLEVLDEI